MEKANNPNAPSPSGREGALNRPRAEEDAVYPTLQEWLQQLKGRDYDTEFVLHDGQLLHTRSGHSYKPEKIRVKDMHHVQGEGEKPHLLYLLQTADGRRGWVAEMSTRGPSRTLSAFLDKVLAEGNA